MLLAVLAHATAFAAPSPYPRTNLMTQFLPKHKPNIIFILADDLGYGDVGCYGQTKIKTPNIDKLAEEGMRFTQCYAGTTVCAPSRACLMTGLHSGHVRIRGNAAVPLQAQDVTVAEVLKSANYHTGAVGKWGLGLAGTPGTPTRQGFEDWVGYLGQTHAHNYYPTQLYRNDTLFVLDKNLYGNKGQYAQDLFSQVASNYVRINKYGSFFLYLAYTIPHANNELKQKGMEVPSDEPYSNENWPQPEKNKAAMITRLDRDIGALMQQLKQLKIDDNTVVFFTSDNGPHKEGGVDPEFFKSSGPLRGIKRDLYEGGIRVPMIARWPGKIKAGTVSEQVWAFWDFLPTAADIAGVSVPPGNDGISMLPTLLGQKQTNQHEFLYWEFHEKGSTQAVRMGDWKAIRPEVGKPLELYHLKADIGETTNVASEHPEIVEQIERYLKTARKADPRWPLLTPKEAAEQKQEEKDLN
ncbi:MAG: N-acetylgalactosamine-6-sulfatase [Verrucomicrobiales bacterium]|nr:N-acetylgalactosamine-6-sulfatase [Verrucomicrobiales bacterium]